MGTDTMTVTVLREGSEALETCHFKYGAVVWTGVYACLFHVVSLFPLSSRLWPPRTSEELDMTQRSWRAKLLRSYALVDTIDRALATCLASEPRVPSSSAVASTANKEKQSADTTSTHAPRDRRPVEESREWQPPEFYVSDHRHARPFEGDPRMSAIFGA